MENKTNNNKTKEIGKIDFPQRISQGLAIEGIQNGTLFKGILRVVQKTRAWVTVDKKTNPLFSEEINSIIKSYDGLFMDILIPDKFCRNKSMQKDVVVIRILEDANIYQISDDPLTIKNLNINLDINDECVEDDDDMITEKKTLFGEVVFIMEHYWIDKIIPVTLHSNEFSDRNKEKCAPVVIEDLNHLNHFDNQLENLDSDVEEILSSGRNLKAIPVDPLLPWMILMRNPTLDRIIGLFDKSGKCTINKTAIYCVKFSIWNTTASLPLCKLVYDDPILGKSGEIETECLTAIHIFELNTNCEEFKPEVIYSAEMVVKRTKQLLEELVNSDIQKLEPSLSICKKPLNYVLPKIIDNTKRIDCRDALVFTIDPSTAKDLDDAIQLSILDDNTIMVIVHIADVSHYVTKDSLMDKVANERTTTVYVPHKNYPMLPRTLSDDMCSLHPSGPKFTFSVAMYVNIRTGEIYGVDECVENNNNNIDLRPVPFESIICSSCRLTYDEVQKWIDNGFLPDDEIPSVYNGYTWEDVQKALLVLRMLTEVLNSRRIDKGATIITKKKMGFRGIGVESSGKMDYPTDYYYETISASHSMIEEVMLAANRCVATILANACTGNPDAWALMRFHQPPLPKNLSKLLKVLKTQFNVEVDVATTDSHLINNAMEEVKRTHSMEISDFLAINLVKCMKRAKYGIFDQSNLHESVHSALCFDAYTHFTSPIRRYMDIVVHRLLKDIIAGNKPSSITKKSVCCDSVNAIQKRTQSLSDSIDLTFFCLYLRGRQEPLVVNSVVAEINEELVVQLYLVGLQKFVKYNGNEMAETIFSKGNIKKEFYTEFGQPIIKERVGKDSMVLTWKYNGKCISMTITAYCVIQVVLVPSKKIPLGYTVRVVPPSHHLFDKSLCSKVVIQESE